MRSSRLAVLALCACLPAAASALPQVAAARDQQLNLRVTVALVPGSGSKLHYRGTFTGAPFGSGTTDVTTMISGSGAAHLTFTLTTRKGSVRGSADATVSYRGNQVNCKGSASITSGTGAYSRFRASGLRISGTTTDSSQNSTLNLSGKIAS
jgi:hypothetical protein